MSVFLGWMPDVATQAALASLRQDIRATLPADAPRHDWRKPAQWHLTLRYLGESVDDAQRTRIEASMDALAGRHRTVVETTLAGAQYWPHARVLVAGIEATGALKALLSQLEDDMQACGFARERAQTAHITLAYLPHGVQTPSSPQAAPGPSVLRIDHVHLLQTVPGGYISLRSWPLPRQSQDP